MESALGLGTTIDRLQHRVLGLLNTSPLERRIIIALSGVPGSGKSTIVTALLAQLERAGIRHVAVAPMVRSNSYAVVTAVLMILGWLPLHKSNSPSFRKSQRSISPPWCAVHFRRHGFRRSCSFTTRRLYARRMAAGLRSCKPRPCPA